MTCGARGTGILACVSCLCGAGDVAQAFLPVLGFCHAGRLLTTEARHP